MKGIRRPDKALRSIVRLIKGTPPYWYYRLTSDSHAEAYAKMRSSEWRRATDAEMSDRIDEESGLQLRFLKKNGLQPDDTLLDIGCGYLRGGAWIIDYLEPENYTGIDISADTIQRGKELLDDELEEKNPRLLVSDDLTFTEFEADSFDYALAQSVFSHLKRDDINECLANLPRVMTDTGRFYATFFDADSHTYDDSNIIYSYDTDEMEALARRNGWDITFIDEEAYPHPGGQTMIEFRC